MKYNFDDEPTLFSNIIIDLELLEDPPFYVLISNYNNKCFIGYIEEFAEYKSCRVVSKVLEVDDVLNNSDSYILDNENEIKEIVKMILKILNSILRV